jgi:acetyl-CoA carboxylase carboxyl transferase subunit alpha
MKQAEKFNRPIFCLVDTSGAFCGIGAEERGQGQAIAENIQLMMSLSVPVISLIIGEGGSGGALALASADEVWMMEDSIYSVISPEGCSSILFKDAKRVEEAAKSLKLTSSDLYELGVVERIIEEGKRDFGEITKEVDKLLITKLMELESLSSDKLLSKRYERFRKFVY